MRAVSLFSGCLGLDLGLEQLGIEAACYVENDKDCLTLIGNRRPGVRVVTDVHDIDAKTEAQFGDVDVVVGGFPCQDMSYAGRGAGFQGDKSVLWFEMIRVIRDLKPRLVLVENVPGLLTRGLPVVVFDLAQAGYVGRWFSFGAVDVGAPHRRERVFVTAVRADRHRGERLDGGHPAGLLDLDVGWLSPQASLFDAEPLRRLGKQGRWTLDSVYEDDARLAMDDDFDAGALLPTPDASLFNDGQSIEAYRERKERELAKGYNGNGGGTTLAMQVRLLPTPGANDATGAEDETRKARQETGSTGGPSLRDLPNLLPTPKAWLGRRPAHSEPGASQRPGTTELPDALAARHDKLLPSPTAVDETKGPSGPNADSPQSRLANVKKLLPTPTTKDGENDGGPSQLARNTPPLNAEVKLLPTPVVTDSFGSRRSTARTEEWKSNPGTTLTDAIWETQGRTEDTRGKLLPTPTSQAAKHGAPTPSEVEQLADGETKSNLWLEVQLLPTPRASPSSSYPDEGRDAPGESLANEVQLLPTPTAEDGERGRNGAGSDRLGAATFDAPLLPTPNTRDHHERPPSADQVPLLPTPVANPDNPGAGGELRAALEHGPGRRNETGIDSLGRPNRGRPSKLLPTPTQNESGRKSDQAQRSRSDGGQGSPPGLGQTARRLLPTPQAADGHGGRQEKGAMANAGVRPSGQKATLPLPTAVSMREEISETPFSEPEPESDTLFDPDLPLLPTPDASANRKSTRAMTSSGRGDGNGRRSGGGQSSPPGLELVAELVSGDIPDDLPEYEDLPPETRQIVDSVRPAPSTASSSDGTALLPTPTVAATRASRRAMVENQQWCAPQIEQALEIARGELPREFEDWDEVPGWMGKTTEADRTASADGVSWGVYEPAIRRWEQTTGVRAPAPTDEKGRLSPEFVEWMLGEPVGWTAVEGISRTARLRMLGNSVQVACGYVAGVELLRLAAELEAS